MKFELRAVLMYDGQYGPKNTYSYCKAFDGSWWKLMGDEITEVRKSCFISTCSDADAHFPGPSSRYQKRLS